MNETALAPVNNGATLPPVFTPERISLIKRTVAKGATDGELELFLATADRLQLDPILHEIHCIVQEYTRKSGERVHECRIQVGIDGYRKRAQEHPQFDGMTAPEWCGPDGKWMDVWLLDEPPAAARIAYNRKDCRTPFWGVARYKSYAQGKTDYQSGKFLPTGKWAESPDNQIAICAERQAIRKAFPSVYAQLRADGNGEVDWDDDPPNPQPARVTIDADTGEVSETNAPEYHDVKDSARAMSAIHIIGSEKGLGKGEGGHDAIKAIALPIVNANRCRYADAVPVTSMTEFTVGELEGLRKFLDESSAETLAALLLQSPPVPKGHTLCMDCGKIVGASQAKRSTEIRGEVYCAACCLRMTQTEEAEREVAARATETVHEDRQVELAEA